MLLHPQDVNGALLWLTGRFWGRDWHFVKIAVPLLHSVLPLSLRFCAISTCWRWAMRAATLGVSVQRTGSGADAGCRDDSNRRGRLWPDKFYSSRRAAHGARIAGGRSWLMPFRP